MTETSKPRTAPSHRFLAAAIAAEEIQTKMRAVILTAFGVTEEDIAALDSNGSYAEARAAAAREEKYVRDVLIPAMVATLEAEIDRASRELDLDSPIYDSARDENAELLDDLAALSTRADNLTTTDEPTP